MSAPSKTAASPARIAANRANAQRSTGPRTAAGKARARANAVKHGLTGAGVALPGEAAAAIEAEFRQMQEEFAPTTVAGTRAVRRMALLGVRLDRAERAQAARLRHRVRHAATKFDRARRATVDRLIGGIEADPAASRRELLLMPEGVERLVDELQTLLGELTGALPMWSPAHHQRLDALLGFRAGDLPWMRPTRFSRAVLGDFDAIAAAEVAHLPIPSLRTTWAMERLIEVIRAEVARLIALGADFDPAEVAADREDAVEAAYFDPDRPAELARRYEATASRELSRLRRDFSAIEAEFGTDPESEVGRPPEDQPAAAVAPTPLAIAEPPAPPSEPPPAPEPPPASPDANPLSTNDMPTILASFGNSPPAAAAVTPPAPEAAPATPASPRRPVPTDAFTPPSQAHRP